MHPHTPQDPRAYNSPEFEPASPPTEREAPKQGTRQTAVAMLIAVVLLAVIVTAIVLL